MDIGLTYKTLKRHILFKLDYEINQTLYHKLTNVNS